MKDVDDEVGINDLSDVRMLCFGILWGPFFSRRYEKTNLGRFRYLACYHLIVVVPAETYLLQLFQ